MSKEIVESLLQFTETQLELARREVVRRRLSKPEVVARRQLGLAERRRIFEARVCVRCGVEMFKPDSTVICDYMLTPEVWASCGFSPKEVSCLRCAEKALNRPLTVEDFLPAIINRTILWCIGRGIRPWNDDR